MRTIQILVGALGALAIGYSVITGEYMDLPGFSDKLQTGRTKNSVAAVIAGIVGQRVYGNSDIDVKIKKKFFPDAKVEGHTTLDRIDTNVDLMLSSSHFTAQKNTASGYLQGRVDKSEFDWGVEQVADNSFKIKRFGPKFNATIHLNVGNGFIEGVYVRPGPHFNWGISGTYDKNGNVNVEIDGPLNLGITLEGKIRGGK